MILGSLKAKSLLRNAHSNVKSRSVLPSKQKVGSIGVISAQEYLMTETLKGQLASFFKISEAAVHEISFQEHIRKDQATQPWFNEKSLTWNGSAKSAILKEFMAREYDILINFYEVSHVALEAVSAGVKARCKVGFTTTETALNDLIIHVPLEDEKTLFDELIKYIRILKIAI